MIINAIAGKNVFKGATADAFAKNMKKAEKSSGKVAKNAKEVNKQLATFDEMNVLSDNKSSSGGGGGGGVSTPTIKPSFDFSNLDLEKPNWVKKIEDHFEKIRTQWQTTKGILKQDWDELKGKWTEWGTNFKSQWQTATGNIANDWNDTKTKISNHFTELKANWDSAMQGLHNTMIDLKAKISAKWDEIKSKIVGVVDGVKTKWDGLKTWFTEKVINPIKDKFSYFKDNLTTIFTNIKDKATSIFTTVKTFITDKIVKPITDKFQSFKTTITDIFGKIRDALKGPLNTMIGWVNKLIDGLNKVSIKVPAWVNEMLGKGYKESKWGFDIKKIPKLARGGIINQPGRGVPLGIGGEHRMEGVIPLTDSQQMQLLGEAIGRYITINANITNSMNGRIIGRELQKIQNENNFAGNR